MATTVVLKSVTKAANGTIYVNFGDGENLEFPSLEMLTQYVKEPDTDVNLTKRLCVARAIALSPQLTNVNQLADKQFIFDLTNNNPIRIV